MRNREEKAKIYDETMDEDFADFILRSGDLDYETCRRSFFAAYDSDQEEESPEEREKRIEEAFIYFKKKLDKEIKNLTHDALCNDPWKHFIDFLDANAEDGESPEEREKRIENFKKDFLLVDKEKSDKRREEYNKERNREFKELIEKLKENQEKDDE